MSATVAAGVHRHRPPNGSRYSHGHSKPTTPSPTRRRAATGKSRPPPASTKMASPSSRHDSPANSFASTTTSTSCSPSLTKRFEPLPTANIGRPNVKQQRPERRKIVFGAQRKQSSNTPPDAVRGSSSKGRVLDEPSSGFPAQCVERTHRTPPGSAAITEATSPAPRKSTTSASSNQRH